jgi:hypothetical protein
MKRAFFAITVGPILLGLASPSHARRELPLSKKLSHTVEYCYLIQITNANPKALAYEIQEVLRRQNVDQPLPKIELFGAAPKETILYVVWATNNHRGDPSFPAEYQWTFFEVVEPEKGRLVIRNIDPDVREKRAEARYLDMSLREFKQMLEEYPFLE